MFFQYIFLYNHKSKKVLINSKDIICVTEVGHIIALNFSLSYNNFIIPLKSFTVLKALLGDFLFKGGIFQRQFLRNTKYATTICVLKVQSCQDPAETVVALQQNAVLQHYNENKETLFILTFTKLLQMQFERRCFEEN